jgi:hypothetical protein
LYISGLPHGLRDIRPRLFFGLNFSDVLFHMKVFIGFRV